MPLCVIHLPALDGGLICPELEVFLEGDDPFLLVYAGPRRITGDGHRAYTASSIQWIEEQVVEVS